MVVTRPATRLGDSERGGDRSRRRAVWQNQHWNYSLKAQHFNELAGTDFPLYRYLFLVIVPDDWTDYATVAPDSVHLKYAGYWHSLRDLERVALGSNGHELESQVPT